MTEMVDCGPIAFKRDSIIAGVDRRRLPLCIWSNYVPGRQQMIALVFGLMMTAASPSSAEIKAVCEVGSVALRDLPSINGNKEFDSYYVAPNPSRPDLLTICPRLKGKIPKGYPIADDEARSRAAVHVPTPGQHMREAFIYSVGVPQISADAKSAVVHFSYSCTGLCGGELEARYIRTSKGWQREGDIRVLSVS